MQINPRSKVGEVVLSCPATARVFEELGIDYCCGGKISIEDACARAGLVCGEVLLRLGAVQAAPAEPDGAPTFAQLGSLIDHIERRHHVFTRDELARATRLMTKVLAAHSHSHPELHRVARLLSALEADLGPHMQKEERVLFPYIHALEASQRLDLPLPTPPFRVIENPLRIMESEHEEVGDLLRQLRERTGGYQPPANACGSFRALYESLASLERDLHQHIHLENNVLFPRARALESQLAAGEQRAAG